MTLYLIYIGDGSALPDVPARNMTKEEVEALPFAVQALLDSKLYKLSETSVKKKEVKDARNDT